MTSRDDLDDLLNQMESHAQRLRESGPLPRVNIRAGDDEPRQQLQYGDWLTENCSLERILYEGEGKMVLLVRHHKVDRVFAMKLLPTSSHADERAIQRFEEEARETSLLGHENIVYVTDFGFRPGLGHYYLMEYLNGETLASRLLGGKPEPLEVVLNVAACAGAGLAAVHDHSLVHRDVRPSNLMSHRQGKQETWKVLDFGRSTKVVGTHEALPLFDEPLYVAPEVAMGTKAGPAADQFSLAATLFHVLYGTPPWPDRSWATALPQHWHLPVIPTEPSSEIHERLTQVLLRALAVDPRNRFASMDDFVAAMHSASGATRRASVPPVDVREANSLAAGLSEGVSLAVDLSFEASGSGNEEPSSPEADTSGSVEVAVAELPGLNLILTMSFKSARRLRREWRRNMIGGGIFVPTARRLETGSPVVVMVEYLPTGAAASFPGKVAGRESDPAPGLAVEIDASYRQAMHDFVSKLQLNAFDPQTVVQATTDPPRNDRLTADEKFLFSKLDHPRTIGELRRLFANLPVPVEDLVARLEEKGWLRVLGAEERATPNTGEVDTVAEAKDVRSVLRRAEYLREQGNYLAEIETLHLASERYEDTDLLLRLAFAKLQFQGDLPGAIAVLERAVALDPDDDRSAQALDGVRRFAAYDAD